jgi:hypothetical protein
VFDILCEIRLVIGLMILRLIGVMAARSLAMGVLCIGSDCGVVAVPAGGVEGRWSEGMVMIGLFKLIAFKFKDLFGNLIDDSDSLFATVYLTTF